MWQVMAFSFAVTKNALENLPDTIWKNNDDGVPKFLFPG